MLQPTADPPSWPRTRLPKLLESRSPLCTPPSLCDCPVRNAGNLEVISKVTQHTNLSQASGRSRRGPMALPLLSPLLFYLTTWSLMPSSRNVQRVSCSPHVNISRPSVFCFIPPHLHKAPPPRSSDSNLILRHQSIGPDQPTAGLSKREAHFTQLSYALHSLSLPCPPTSKSLGLLSVPVVGAKVAKGMCRARFNA